EVARLRAQIDLEVEALQRIKSGFARVATHEIIMNRYRVIDACYEQLVQHVGEEKAIDEICERLNTIK
ncbi:MAG: hypothetical protein ACRDHW_07425, partial [Ktedonobacteraceae bacterium]